MAKLLYHIYDQNTLEITGAGFFEEGQHPENSTLKSNTGFIKAMYNIELYEIYEGATVEEIAELKTPIYELKIIEKFTYLMNRALSSSMGKYGSYEYLQIQKQEYDKKYLVAKGIEINVPVANAIQKEMLRDFPVETLDYILTQYGVQDLSGTQIEKMYLLIIIRYEYAKQRLDVFEGMAIDFRTKSRTLVELFQWPKLDIAFQLVKNFPDNPTDIDIENYYNQFDTL